MTRYLAFLALPALQLVPAVSQAQSAASLARIAAMTPKDKAVESLVYLASDQLKGRYIGRPEIDTAALYIADQFRKAGARTVPGATGYFQVFTREFGAPSSTGSVLIGMQSFVIGENAAVPDPGNIKIKASLVDLTDTSAAALSALDLRDKLVLIHAGHISPATSRQDMRRIAMLRRTLAGKGCKALLVLLAADADYWKQLQRSGGRERLIDPNRPVSLPLVYLLKPQEMPAAWGNGIPDQAFLDITAAGTRQLRLRNVMAYVPGTDPELRDQFVLLSSHYDHLGVTPTPEMEEGKLDSIYNGARDNATGTTAVIDAARYFAKYPARRSILFITYTAEEEGLIGSQYYADHPVLPLNKIVYNLNIDNASYDDTTLISLVGLNRTTEDSSIIRACRAYGLTVNGDPTGGSLFYASDNTPLAQKGVPAPTYSLGMRAMDSTIFNRYHRLSDETGNMNMNYIVKFIRAYILSAQSIADDARQPKWTKGDQYEKVWLTLYPNAK